MKEKIIKYVYAAINLKQEESALFFLLFFHSFFLGIFISVYYTLANSVFIQNFESKYLSVGYLVSGIAGYLTTLLYSYIQKRFQLNRLFMVSLLFVFVLSFALWFCVKLFGVKVASFMLFVFSMPFQSVIGLEMGGLALQLLDIKQIKRLFSLINTGTILSSILGYLSVPLLMKMTVFSNSFNLIFIGIFGIGASILLLIKINRLFADKLVQKKNAGTNRTTHPFSYYFQNPLFVYISLSVLISAIAMYFSDFAFLAGLRSQETLVSTPEGRANFLALAYGLMKIGELIIATIASKFFSKYGMNFAISTISFIETVLIMIATLTGLIAGEDSLLLFIFILLNKSFDSMLRRTINDPAFKILYQTLPEEQRMDIQTKVGMVSQFAIIISGVLLMVVNQLFISNERVMFNLFLLSFLPFLFAWFFSSRKIHQHYKKRLRIILTDKSFQKKRYIVAEDYSIEYLKAQLNKPTEKFLPATVLIVSEFNVMMLSPYLSVLQQSKNKLCQKFAQNSANFQHIVQHSQVNENEIATLSKSTQLDDIFKLIAFLQKNSSYNSESILLDLLEHKNAIVRQLAIRLAIKKATPILMSQLFNMVIDKKVSRTVMIEFQQIGDPILDEMDKFFRDITDNSVLLRIIELFAHIGTDNAKLKLVQHINFPDKTVMLAIIKALKFCKYQADEKGKILIKQRIASSVQYILWTYSAILDLVNEKNTLKIIQSVDMEREMEFEILFDLLSLIYDWAIIDLIKTNFVGEENIFALELIDNFIEQEIKDMIVPLFEGLTIKQQLRKLENRFPQPRFEPIVRLKDIINKDFNKVDLWTKTKAIELLAKNSEEVPQEIYACLHHKNELIWSTAAQIVFEKTGEEGLRRIERSRSISQKYIRSLSRNDNDLQNVITEKVKLIKRIPQFFGIPENELVKLAAVFRTRLLGTNAKLQLVDDSGDELIVLLLKGKLVYQSTEGDETAFSRKEMIIKGYNLDENAKEMEVQKGALVLVASRTEFFNMIVDELMLTRSMVQES